MREILIGILASLFFAVTFILNRSMELSGGSWLWSASLRYFAMVPFLVAIVAFRNNFKQLIEEFKKKPYQWLLWSFVGFGLFYAPITFAAAYGPGWIVAGTWQLTIIAGVLMSPLFFYNIQRMNGSAKVRQRIPITALYISIFILLGVILIQSNTAEGLTITSTLLVVFPVLIAAFAYPLGNRKMMEVCDNKLDTFQRVLGMTLASMPLWIILATIGYFQVGLPSINQVIKSSIVGISSGVIATTLFFIATDRVHQNQTKLAAVEATQSTQVLFVIIGEVLLLSAPLPNGIAIVGILFIMLGMILHSAFSKTKQKKPILLKKSST
ncbi:DMT family transporter [Bacillus sp. FJAT-45066]|uniref:DMT family transporter n=1 Tax=Bacillus sp. FJAT-45066 TaxID=2011010 RepID=UPI000BB788BB|nr:multidrug resistance efflux transporter family protein [Bacillus sp. FJAT-45066]